MRHKPRRMFRARPPAVRIVDTYSIDGEDVPRVEVVHARGLDQMAVDRLIGDTGLTAWVRATRGDDGPDTSRAIDPTPAGLAAAAEYGADLARAGHVLVRQLAPGVRTREPVALFPHHTLN